MLLMQSPLAFRLPKPEEPAHRQHQPASHPRGPLRFMPKPEIRYRPSVAAILRNPSGEILICERLDVRGAWQFPQGGIDGKESAAEALVREIWVEIGMGSKDFRVLEERGPY